MSSRLNRTLLFSFVLVGAVACSLGCSASPSDQGSAEPGPTSGASEDGASPDAAPPKGAEDTLGCDGALVVSGAVSPSAALAGELWPTNDGYVAFFADRASRELRMQRFDDGLAPVGAETTLFGDYDGNPSTTVVRDGEGFLASAILTYDDGRSPPNERRLTALDARGAQTWSIRDMISGGQATPGDSFVLVHTKAAGGALGTIVPRGGSRDDAVHFDLRSYCEGTLDAPAWRAGRFEGLCSARWGPYMKGDYGAGFRLAVSPDGTPTAEPVRYAPYPDAMRDHCHSIYGERYDGTGIHGVARAADGVVMYAYVHPKLSNGSEPECDATPELRDAPPIDESWSLWTTKLSDGHDTWTPWTKAVELTRVRRFSTSVALDGDGVAALGVTESGAHEIRRGRLDGTPRGAPLLYDAPAEATYVDLVAIKRGYLVRSHSFDTKTGSTLVEVERLTCK